MYDGLSHIYKRFIPTLVGNTKQIPASMISKAVHPHACGEHTSLNLLKKWSYFSRRFSTNKSAIETGRISERNRFIFGLFIRKK